MKAMKKILCLFIILLFVNIIILKDCSFAQNVSNSSSISEFHVSNHHITLHNLKKIIIERLKQKNGFCHNNEFKYSININNKSYFTGLRPPTEEDWKRIKEEGLVTNKINYHDKLPDSIDHSISPYFPPIGNQSKECSCVCWSIVYYIKTFQEAKEHDWNLSLAKWETDDTDNGYPSVEYQDKIMSPDFVYHLINMGKNIGVSYWDAVNILYQIGVCSWMKMPNDAFNYTAWPSEEAWRESLLYRSKTKSNYLLLYSEEGINNLKSLLASGNLAAIGIDASQFPQLDENNNLWTLDNYKVGSGHANTVVGYDDNYGPYQENGETRYGAFKIVNSWGDLYPNYWISYEAMKNRVLYGIFFSDEIAYQPKLLSVFQLNHSKRNDCLVRLQLINKNNHLLSSRFYECSVMSKPFIYPWLLGTCSYPDNKIILDLTEFAENMIEDTPYKIIFTVFDFGLPFGSISKGEITHFSMEYYTDYVSGDPQIVKISDDAPMKTSNNKKTTLSIEFSMLNKYSESYTDINSIDSDEIQNFLKKKEF